MRQLSCFPPPMSIPFSPMQATWVIFGSEYSTKQYPLEVTAALSCFTRWNAFTAPNALRSSRTWDSWRWYGSPPMNILFGPSGTVGLTIPSRAVSSLGADDAFMSGANAAL